MPLDLSSELSQVTAVYDSWLALVPNLENPMNVDGRETKADDVTHLFEVTIGLFKALERTDADHLAWIVKRDTLASDINNLANALPVAPRPASYYTEANLYSIFFPLHAIKELLLELLPPVPLSPRQVRDIRRKELELDSDLTRIRELENEIAEIRGRSGELVNLLETELGQGNLKLADVSKVALDSETLAKGLQTSNDDIEAILLGAQKTKASLAEISDDLTASVALKNELFEEIATKKSIIEQILGNASKVGLANSFKLAKEAKNTPQITWSISFIAPLILMAVMTYRVIIHSIDKGIVLSFNDFLPKLGYVTPLLLISYFAAKQYSFASRIAADYAFKEATALAYNGYRDEFGGDKDLLILLQTNAITHFGENPMHLLLKGNERAMPGEGGSGGLLEYIEKGLKLFGKK